MKVIGITGEPGVGKTTLMKNIINTLGPGVRMKYRKLAFCYFRQPNIVILGDYYNGKMFQGTDVLSNVVIDDTKKLIKGYINSENQPTIIFEGDRLNNRSFLDFLLPRCELRYFRLCCDVLQLENRINKRQSKQTAGFRQRIKTKLNNLKKEYEVNEIDTTFMDEHAVFRHIMRESGLAQEVMKIGKR